MTLRDLPQSTHGAGALGQPHRDADVVVRLVLPERVQDLALAERQHALAAEMAHAVGVTG